MLQGPYNNTASVLMASQDGRSDHLPFNKCYSCVALTSVPPWLGSAKTSLEHHVPAPSPLTALVEVVKQLAEQPTVGLTIRVSDQHVHISAGGLPTTVGATCHTHEPRLQGQGCLSDLQEQRGKEGRRVTDYSLNALSVQTANDLAPASASPAAPGSPTELTLGRHGKLPQGEDWPAVRSRVCWDGFHTVLQTPSPLPTTQ